MLSPQNKKPFIQLCLFGSLTLLAILNMIYLIVKGTDPFAPYLLSDLIGSVPLFPYFIMSINVTIIFLSVTLLTLTSVIQADTEALLHHYMIPRHQAQEVAPDASRETPLPLIAAPRPATSPVDAAIHALNEQVQTLHTEVTHQRRDALIQELQDITLAAATMDAPDESPTPLRVVEDQPPAPQLTLHSPPHAIKGIGAKTETALHAIGITTVGEFLVADSTWIAEHTPMSTKRVQHFQDTAYASVATDTQPPAQPVLTPAIA